MVECKSAVFLIGLESPLTKSSPILQIGITTFQPVGNPQTFRRQLAESSPGFQAPITLQKMANFTSRAATMWWPRA